MQSYKTVEKQASAEFVEKRSRFIGYVCPVSTVDEANAFIADISKKHFDAKHNVYAYILKDGSVKKYSDDGEPQGTAGMPVLEVMEKNGLFDVCIVVTRYFGGILLGGGGLFRAYTQAAKLAIEAGGIACVSLCCVMSLECDYGFYSKANLLITERGGVITDSEFGENVHLVFHIGAGYADNISDSVFETSNGKFRPKKIDECYLKTKN